MDESLPSRIDDADRELHEVSSKLSQAMTFRSRIRGRSPARIRAASPSLSAGSGVSGGRTTGAGYAGAMDGARARRRAGSPLVTRPTRGYMTVDDLTPTDGRAAVPAAGYSALEGSAIGGGHAGYADESSALRRAAQLAEAKLAKAELRLAEQARTIETLETERNVLSSKLQHEQQQTAQLKELLRNREADLQALTTHRAVAGGSSAAGGASGGIVASLPADVAADMSARLAESAALSQRLLAEREMSREASSESEARVRMLENKLEEMEGYYRMRDSMVAAKRARREIRRFKQGIVAFHLRRSHVRRVLRSWQAVARRQRELSQLYVHWQRVAPRRQASTVLRRWLAATRKRRLLRRLLKRCIGGSRRAALQQWRAVTHAAVGAQLASVVRMSQARTLGHALSVSRRSALARGFARWRAADARALRLRALLRRAAAGGLASGFSRWRAAVWSAERQEVAASAVARALDRWRSARLAAGLRRWRSATDASAAACNTLRRTMLRLRAGTLARAFRTWHDEAVDAAAKEGAITSAVSKAERMLRRFQRRNLAAAWNSWLAAAAAKSDAEHRLAAFLRRWRARQTAAALLTWRDATLKRGRAALTVARVLRRWEDRQLASALSSWRALTAERHAGRVWMARRVLRRWQSRLLSSAFTSWREGVVERDAASALCVRVLRRWQSRMLSSAFATWREGAAERDAATALCDRVLRRWASGLLGSALTTWRDNALQRHKQETRARELMTRTLARVRNRALFAAFSRWGGATRAARSARGGAALIRRTLAAWRARALGSAFRRWSSGASLSALEEMRRTYEMQLAAARRDGVLQRATRVLRRWQSGQLLHALRTWKQVVLEAGAAEERADSGRRRLLAIVSKLARQQEAAAFRTWADAVRRAHEHEASMAAGGALLRRTLNRLVRQQEASAFRAWAAHVRRAGMHDASVDAGARLLRRSLISLARRREAAALRRWRHNAAAKDRSQLLLRRTLLRLARGKEASAVARWRQQVQLAARQRAVLARLLGKAATREKAAAWRAWKLSLLAKSAEDAMREARAEFLDVRLSTWARTAFSKWRERTVELREAEWRYVREESARTVAYSRRLLDKSRESVVAMQAAQRLLHRDNDELRQRVTVAETQLAKQHNKMLAMLDNMSAHSAAGGLMSRAFRAWARVSLAEKSARLRAEMAELGGDDSDVADRLLNLRRQLEHAKAEVDRLRRSADARAAALDDDDMDDDELQVELEREKEAARAAQRRVRELTATLRELEVSYEAQTQHLERVLAENDQLRMEVETFLHSAVPSTEPASPLAPYSTADESGRVSELRRLGVERASRRVHKLLDYSKEGGAAGLDRMALLEGSRMDAYDDDDDDDSDFSEAELASFMSPHAPLLRTPARSPPGATIAGLRFGVDDDGSTHVSDVSGRHRQIGLRTPVAADFDDLDDDSDF